MERHWNAGNSGWRLKARVVLDEREWAEKCQPSCWLGAMIEKSKNRAECRDIEV